MKSVFRLIALVLFGFLAFLVGWLLPKRLQETPCECNGGDEADDPFDEDVTLSDLIDDGDENICGVLTAGGFDHCE